MKIVCRSALLLLLALAGCTSPEPTYYTLTPVPGVAHGGAPRVVELRRIGLAGYLDRADVVYGRQGVQVQIANSQRWAEPLGDLIGRVLAENLTERLPGTTVYSAAGSISAEPDATVEVDIQRFDANSSGQLDLLAQVAIERRGSHRAEAARTVRLSQPISGSGTPAQVTAMSAALGKLADTVAGLLRR
jgi:uncharacterized lipoprotein YmbA